MPQECTEKDISYTPQIVLSCTCHGTLPDIPRPDGALIPMTNTFIMVLATESENYLRVVGGQNIDWNTGEMTGSRLVWCLNFNMGNQTFYWHEDNHYMGKYGVKCSYVVIKLFVRYWYGYSGNKSS